MTTKTLYIDSRTKIKGNHADFSISLPEQMTLWGSRARVDNIRMTDTFATVSDRNRYVYFLNGSGSLPAFALTPGAGLACDLVFVLGFVLLLQRFAALEVVEVLGFVCSC